MARVPGIYTALVIISLLARVNSQYHYQQPIASLPFASQHYIGQTPQGFQYPQGNLQQSYDRSPPHNYYSPQISINQNSQGLSYTSNSNIHGIHQRNVHHGGQNVVNTNQNIVNFNSNSVAPVQPIITKHIYFHAAPPDVESVTVQPVKKKKTYNIVFIKVPSQSHYGSSQGFSTNPFVRVEDKTLIYVLVKNREDQQRERAKPPNHEVYYVKYKGNVDKAASLIKEQSGPATPGLRPGLANGQT